MTAPKASPAFSAVPALAIFIKRMDLLAVKAVGPCRQVSHFSIVAVDYCHLFL